MPLWPVSVYSSLWPCIVWQSSQVQPLYMLWVWLSTCTCICVCVSIMCAWERECVCECSSVSVLVVCVCMYWDCSSFLFSLSPILDQLSICMLTWYWFWHLLLSVSYNTVHVVHIHTCMLHVLHVCFPSPVGLTGPYPRLVKRRPIGTLAGVHVVLSILTQTFIMIAFQIGILFYAKSEPW